MKENEEKMQNNEDEMEENTERFYFEFEDE